MTKHKAELLQGTLDLLILKSLQRGAIHGFGISVAIRRMSQDMLTIEQGSLYPALYRLVEQGLIKAEWGLSENNRRARFYSLTKAGRREFANETAYWERISTAINLVLSSGGPSLSS